jgi:RND family efflux transporter MFP subunit
MLMRAVKEVGATRLKVRRRWPFVAAAVSVVALIGVFIALNANKPPAAATDAEAQSREQLVTAIEVTSREFTRTAPVSGEARPYRDIRVFAPMTGVRVMEVMAEIGDQVEEGQPLARLDTEVVSAQVTQAEAEVREATIEQKRTEEEWNRIDPIADEAALSQEEIATRRAAADSAKARLAAERAALAQIKARVQGGFVRAPAAGLVIERNANVGEMADNQALFRIVGEGRLEVAAAVSERDILALSQGQTAIFTTSDGKTVEATLRVAPVAVGSETRTGTALFDLPADAGVRAGMYLRGEVVVERTRALGVPIGAVSYATGSPSVFVIENGKAHLTPVTLGARTGDFIAIVSGLREGQTVAAAGGAFLLDGDSVRTTTQGAENPSVASNGNAG